MLEPSLTLCANCGAETSSAYCGVCGERRFDHHALSLRHFAEHAFEAFVHFDSTIIRSIRTLVAQPGRLTADWARGCRKPYLSPVQFFLLMNLLFFVAQSLNHWNTLTTNLDVHITGTAHRDIARRMVNEKLAKRQIDYKLYQPMFDARATIQAKSMVILMVPFFALAATLLGLGLHRYIVEHLVFSLHFYAFLLLYLSLANSLATLTLWALHAGGIVPSDNTVDAVASTILLGGVAAYLAIAVRTVYRNQWWVSLAKAAALTWVCLQILYLYRFLLFLVTCYST